MPLAPRCLLMALTLSLTVTAASAAWAQTPAPPNGANAAEAPAPVDPAAQPAPADAADVPHTRMQELAHKLRQGGRTVVVQLLLSVLGLGVVLERLYNLRRSRIASPALAAQADALWKKGQFDQLTALCARDRSTLALVIDSIVRHRKTSHQTVSTVAGDVASREMRRHAQRLYPIAVVATLEPLLGLLGTILGMIGAFDTVARAGSMGDASILADDIAKALVTTAVGLIIAIPALFLYQYLRSRVGFLSASLEEQASDLISEWIVLPGEAGGRPEIPPPSAAAPTPQPKETPRAS
jgi:biopolymer transport protein ExbB